MTHLSSEVTSIMSTFFIGGTFIMFHNDRVMLEAFPDDHWVTLRCFLMTVVSNIFSTANVLHQMFIGVLHFVLVSSQRSMYNKPVLYMYSILYKYPSVIFDCDKKQLFAVVPSSVVRLTSTYLQLKAGSMSQQYSVCMMPMMSLSEYTLNCHVETLAIFDQT